MIQFDDYFSDGLIPPTNQLVYVKTIMNPKKGPKKAVMECFDRIFKPFSKGYL